MNANLGALKRAEDNRSVKLRARLISRTSNDKDFWSFNATRSRSGNHALFQYPAMMVPELQGALLDDLLAVDDDVSFVYDPFAGSGTVMLESLYRGLDFHGSDINPLAILLCQVKAAPPSVDEASAAVRQMLAYIADQSDVTTLDFSGIDKWFKPEIKTGLSKLREAIMDCGEMTARRFLWICLAETIRLVSNSRTSTFKLHTYTADEIAKCEKNALKVFKLVAELNASRLTQHWRSMAANLARGKTPSALLSSGPVSNPWTGPRLADALMTSPPYGDNKTTVPYGQHSYLPLRWIDSADIPGGFKESLLESTSRIDFLSLGGSLKHADEARADLSIISPSLERFLCDIDHIPPLRKKVLSFCRDYRQSLSTISTRLKSGAFCFMTLGERRVGKQTFPLVEITKELLAANGHELVETIERVLPGSRKRMAAKNSEGLTMTKEWILVTRSWGSVHD